MLSEKEMEQAVIRAKKSLSDEQIKDAMKRCSYGGKPVTMDLKGGVTFGKTN